MFTNKLKASAIHLGLSILLVGLVIGSIIFFFFPHMFISVTDFKEVAAIIISVDLILGPILTFVVFQPKKKSLKFDLSVVAAIQLTALVYGAYALYQVHPVFITFNVDRFTIVNARDADPENALYDEYKVSKLSTAKFAFAKLPEDSEKIKELTLTAAQGGRDLDQRIEYYEPYENHIDQILAKSLDREIILTAAKSDKNIKSFIDKNLNNIDEFVFLPINSAKKDAIIVLDRQTAQPIATINSDPWELSKK